MRKIYLVICLLCLISCGESSPVQEELPGSIEQKPLVYDTESGTLLKRLDASQTGIDFANQLGREFFIKYTYNGAGVAAGDYDNDGLPDVYVVSEQSPNKLYRNLGDFRFEDVTETVGLTNVTDEGGLSVGANFADIDNDGDLDLFITNWKVSNKLFRNEGGKFVDITEEAGVDYAGGATTSTFADYDRDGDLDFFVATYRPVAIEYEQSNLNLSLAPDGSIVIPDELSDRITVLSVGNETATLRELGERDLLYRNDGTGKFEEVALEAGIEGGFWGLSAVFSDINNDQWPDLYITNDLWSPDQLYKNNGDGTFSLIENDMIQHTPWFSMGIDFADINNDGWFDYFIGDMVSTNHEERMTQHGEMDMSPAPLGTAPQVMRNGMYLNNQDGSFSDIAWLSGLARSDWTWTAKFADMDLDGFVDLLITNGMVRDLMDADFAEQTQIIGQTQGRDAVLEFINDYPSLDNANLVFKNNGDLSFDEVSEEWGFNTAQVGHGATLADFDADGDLDAMVNNLNNPIGVYRNDADNDRITVQLRGQASNRDGIGARVTLETDSGIQTRMMTTSGGYLSGHEPLIVFGLAKNSVIRSLSIEWPSGHIQNFPDETVGSLGSNQAYVVTEPSGSATIRPSAQPPKTQFTDISQSAGLTYEHVEDEDFNDFAEQPLLPRRLSTLGPGIAWADLDGDGDDDLTVAGAAGQAGVSYFNNGDGTFREQVLSGDVSAEEMHPLVLDGTRLSTLASVENTRPLAVSQDGQPIGGMDSIGVSSAAAISANDFDGDGDLDLFVGGRVKPNQWPLPTDSFLFRNDGGSYTDVTDSVAPDLRGLGLATGAIWTDVDGDVDSDLLVATEWGAIQLFRNDDGRLTIDDKSPDDGGLAEWTGLWTGIVSADFDGDGDLDLAAANLGQNTPYVASVDEPLVLYAGDIDGESDLDLLETYWVDGTLYPFRYRGMVGEEMEFVYDEWDSYRAYAQATFDEIFGNRVNDSMKFSAVTLDHSFFWNDGAGNFTRQSFPRSAQAMAGYGLTVADFDNDGLDDVYMVGNFSHADMEHGVYHGGTSFLLRNLGNQRFSAQSGSETGLFVPQDGRGVAVSDFDGDGWIDVAVGANEHEPLLFKNNGIDGNQSVNVSLNYTPENPTGVGAIVTATLPDGSSQSRQVQAGSGYLSQDSGTLVFGIGNAEMAEIKIVWPNGEQLTRSMMRGESLMVSP